MHHCSTLVEKKLLFINPAISASHARRVSQPCSDGDSSRCCWFIDTTIVAVVVVDGARGSKSYFEIEAMYNAESKTILKPFPLPLPRTGYTCQEMSTGFTHAKLVVSRFARVEHNRKRWLTCGSGGRGKGSYYRKCLDSSRKRVHKKVLSVCVCVSVCVCEHWQQKQQRNVDIFIR